MPLITIHLERAVQELLTGKTVAIPTETVYGLAAMINKPNAVKTIFALKNRPLNHPLIVHIAPDWDLNLLVEEIPHYAHRLIAEFWPGPLTLVFRCKPNIINPLINGGQSTVAVRCPAHPIAQKLLNKLPVPIVAPSANPFGKISPTTALHVKHSFNDKELLILDGGRCNIGIESTIIDATHAHSYQILRPGLITQEAINKVISLPHNIVAKSIRVPGALESHYQPEKNLYYFENLDMINRFCEKNGGDVFVIANQKPPLVTAEHFHLLGDNPEHAAFELYYQLRNADASDAMCIAIELPPIPVLGVA